MGRVVVDVFLPPKSYTKKKKIKCSLYCVILIVCKFVLSPRNICKHLHDYWFHVTKVIDAIIQFDFSSWHYYYY